MKRLTKRKIKNILSKNHLIILLLVVLASFLLMTTGYSLLTSQKNIEGSTEIEKSDPPKDNIVTDGDASLELGENETGLRVVKELVAEHDWGGDANRYKITIYNDTDKPITSFRGIVKYPGVQFSYGDYIISHDNEGTHTAEVGCTWMTIPPGGSITMEFVLINVFVDGYYPDIVIVGTTS